MLLLCCPVNNPLTFSSHGFSRLFTFSFLFCRLCFPKDYHIHTPSHGHTGLLPFLYMLTCFETIQKRGSIVALRQTLMNKFSSPHAAEFSSRFRLHKLVFQLTGFVSTWFPRTPKLATFNDWSRCICAGVLGTPAMHKQIHHHFWHSATHTRMSS